jgi:hypothetical protein
MKTGSLQTETLTICGWITEFLVPLKVKNPEAKCIGCGLINKYIYVMNSWDEFELRFDSHVI